MPTVPRAGHTVRNTIRAAAAMTIAALLSSIALVLLPAPAHAAEQGAGFGTWAPISEYGWHGSMLVDGVHTYCILPGAPAPTGPSVDNGISATAAGLSPQQLTGINLLVTKYGQTSDPVQAAAVGWAVKAIADWSGSLHHFGYPGDSLAGAIHWTFSALAPEHDEEIQRRAVVFYEEARATPTGSGPASGSVTVTADATDPTRGTVRVDATASATGRLSMDGAVFDDTGAHTRTDAATGVDYAITATPPTPGRPFSVSATGHFSAGPAAAVRHFTTAGGQDTAGPAGNSEFDVAGADTAPRHPLFAPTISTQVATRYASPGPFVDDVVFGGMLEHWPRGEDAGLLQVAATAVVYRTEHEPASADGSIPADAEPVGSLAVQTDSQRGSAGPYRVSSLWDLPGPGFYTAVWTIDRESQSAEVAAHLAPGYRWVEAFAERTQVSMIPAISSAAEPEITAGRPMSDTIIVGAPLPSTGLIISSAVYRAAEATPPQDACTDTALFWSSEPLPVSSPGEYSVTSPPITEPGTYYWQERAVDADGELVHLGVCGAASETTIVTALPPETSPPRTLAATGQPETAARAGAGAGVAALTAGATLILLARRRRFVARPPIG